MLRKIALTGVTAAAIVGVGTAALAASGPSSTAGSGNTGSTHSAQAKTKADHKHPDRKHKGKQRIQALRHSVHGSIVTKGKDGYVVLSAIRGTVSSVSATSLTVKAADGYSQTYTLAKTTKVRERVAGKKPAAGKVSDLKTGDKVGVVGKAADKAGTVPTATVVVDGLKK